MERFTISKVWTKESHGQPLSLVMAKDSKLVWNPISLYQFCPQLMKRTCLRTNYRHGKIGPASSEAQVRQRSNKWSTGVEIQFKSYVSDQSHLPRVTSENNWSNYSAVINVDVSRRCPFCVNLALWCFEHDILVEMSSNASCRRRSISFHLNDFVWSNYYIQRDCALHEIIADGKTFFLPNGWLFGAIAPRYQCLYMYSVGVWVCGSWIDKIAWEKWRFNSLAGNTFASMKHFSSWNDSRMNLWFRNPIPKEWFASLPIELHLTLDCSV